MKYLKVSSIDLRYAVIFLSKIYFIFLDLPAVAYHCGIFGNYVKSVFVNQWIHV